MHTLISCQYIGDVLTFDQIYTSLSPSPYSTHGLREHMSHRVESRLEGFHYPLSNFGNSGMARMITDILNSAGTSRYNANIRQKKTVQKYTDEEQKLVPSHYLNIPKYYNHGEVALINENTIKTGVEFPPFLHLQIPKEDNGERFFSQYWEQQNRRNNTVTPHINNDRCQCEKCGNNPEP